MPRHALAASHPTTTARSSSYPPPLAVTQAPNAWLAGARDPAHEPGLALDDPPVEPLVVARHPLQREPPLGGVATVRTVDLGHPLNCADHLPLVTAEVPGP